MGRTQSIAKPEDMQLVIPIEDPSSGSKSTRHCMARQQDEPQVENQPASAAAETIAGNDAILSAELRDQFETMKSIWRQARRGKDDERSSSSNDNADCRGRRVRVREDLKRKEREMAVETAIKVQNEIETWQNGIADLEALLAAEEQEFNEEVDDWEGAPQDEGENGPPGIREIAFVRRSNNAPQHPPQIRFPFLPQAIPTEDETEDEDLITMSTTASSRV